MRSDAVTYIHTRTHTYVLLKWGSTDSASLRFSHCKKCYIVTSGIYFLALLRCFCRNKHDAHQVKGTGSSDSLAWCLWGHKDASCIIYGETHSDGVLIIVSVSFPVSHCSVTQNSGAVKQTETQHTVWMSAVTNNPWFLILTHSRKLFFHHYLADK